MKIYVLSSKKSFNSARILAELCNARLTSRSEIIPNSAIVIRYGNTNGNFPNCIGNTSNFIEICRNKLLFSEIMLENNIYSPIYYNAIVPEEFPVLIRKTLFGMGGNGIVVCNSLEEFENNWRKQYYWTPIIQTSFELRAHIVGGNIIRIFKKLPKYEDSCLIKNSKVCHFSLINIEKYPKLIKLVEELTQIFGKDCFYGMDVGWDSISKKYCIFEINSAPGLNRNTALEYANFLRNIIYKKYGGLI